MTRSIILLGISLAATDLACRSATMPAPSVPPEAAAASQAEAPPTEPLRKKSAEPTAAQIEAVSQTVRAVLGRQLSRTPDQIPLASRLQADLGMNAYDQAMMRLELEEYYNIVLPSQSLDTVGALVSFIAREIP